MEGGIALNVPFAAHAGRKTHLVKIFGNQAKKSKMHLLLPVGRLNIKTMHKETKYLISSFVSPVTGNLSMFPEGKSSLNFLISAIISIYSC